MVDEQELKLWIARLETEESSWPNYQKLAALYIIQNHNKPETISAPEPVSYSFAAAPVVAEYGDSDFLRTVSGKDQSRAWAVMDELMDTLQVVNSRVYNNVMRKIEAL